MIKTHWLDRVTETVAPRWTLKRIRARVASAELQRHYEGNATGRRTQGWRRSAGDANAVIGPALVRLRENARDLVRNNPYAESALGTIADHTVGWGITAKPLPTNPRALAAWRRWAESTDCDAAGRQDFYGLQKLIMRSVPESGEILVRRRWRRPEDGFALPLQLQILDPDYLDITRDDLAGVVSGAKGFRTIQGVEYDAIGRRTAYWLFREHPGSRFGTAGTSVKIPASEILHIFRPTRPGQVRAPSWFAPVLLRFKDFDEFEDATLMKQKIAACLAVITSDPDGSATELGTVDDPTRSPQIDSLEPGAILNVPPGRAIDVVQPPKVDEYANYSKSVLRAIATGLGVTYEDLTGDYTDMPFSAARMSRLRHWARVDDWRWRILIPQFCDPVWRWAMEAASITGDIGGAAPGVEWTAPPAPMIDPAAEGLAYMRNIRTGIMSWSEAVRERGLDPVTLAAEIAADNKAHDKLGIVLDSDPRKMTQGGQAQSSNGAAIGADPPKADPPADGTEAPAAGAKA